MSTLTSHLGIQLLSEGQDGAEVTTNEAINKLENFSTRIVVLSKSTTAPPGSPTDGDAYIVPSGATGIWSGKTNQIALYLAGWAYWTPREGWRAYSQDDNSEVVYDGSAWTAAGDGATTLDGLSDVTITSAAANDTLQYNGSAWVNVADPTFGATTCLGGTALKAQSGTFAILAGADGGATTLTNSTNKLGRIVCPHYTNAEEPVMLIYGTSESSASNVIIGGGSGIANAATRIAFYVAADTTSLTGTKRGELTDDGWLFKRRIRHEIVTVIDGATPSFDARESNDWRWTLAANRTLDNITNPTDGQFIRLEVVPGSFTLAFNTTNFKVASSVGDSTMAGVTMFGLRYRAALSKWVVISKSKED